MFSLHFKALAVFAMVASCGLTACGSSGGGGGSTSNPVPVPTTSATTAPTPTPTTEPNTQVVTTTPVLTPSTTTVAAGETVTVVATGTVAFLGPNEYCTLGPGNCHVGPNGLPWSTCANLPPPAFTAPGLNCWSLIGRIGLTGKPFQLGSSMTFTAAEAGLLYVGINDNVFTDNTGSWAAAFTPVALVTP